MFTACCCCPNIALQLLRGRANTHMLAEGKSELLFLQR
jgi:hypothetical protein